jgi:23S rRNA (adenine2503-C2)-methyltransferase
MNLKKLNKILENEPQFRKKQINQLIYKNGIDDWFLATNLSKSLKEELIKNTSLKIDAKVIKDNNTEKALITLEDGNQIEAVLMKHNDRNTVCVSSQVGCSLGCKFCATGKMGLIRNLTKEEILEQILFFKRNNEINNIVFMGMGEPFLNYENVMLAIHDLNNKDLFNIGARHISISTVGITEGIKKLQEENLQINLAISLHAPNNKLRESIMPVNKKYSIEKILKASDEYIKKTNRKVMIEYLLIKDINDSLNEARELVTLLKNKKLYMVNLIKYNDTKEFKSPDKTTIQKFKQYLEKGYINVVERYRFGTSIHAACGQLCIKK